MRKTRDTGSKRPNGRRSRGDSQGTWHAVVLELGWPRQEEGRDLWKEQLEVSGVETEGITA